MRRSSSRFAYTEAERTPMSTKVTVHKTVLALMAAGALALAGCGAGGNDEPAPAAALEHSDVAELDATEVIEDLDTMPVSERPTDLMASVEPRGLVLTDTTAEEQPTILPLPEDRFYLSVAPYENRTHQCYFHSLTTCLGEMSSEEVHVTVTDDATGDTLIDEPRTTYDNGFIGLWLPRDINATLTINYDDKSASAPIATGDQDLTCLTTMKLT